MIAAEERDGYMPSFTDALYQLLNDGWTLDVEWFEWTDGTYKDDEEKEIHSQFNEATQHVNKWLPTAYLY